LPGFPWRIDDENRAPTGARSSNRTGHRAIAAALGDAAARSRCWSRQLWAIGNALTKATGRDRRGARWNDRTVEDCRVAFSLGDTAVRASALAGAAARGPISTGVRSWCGCRWLRSAGDASVAGTLTRLGIKLVGRTPGCRERHSGSRAGEVAAEVLQRRERRPHAVGADEALAGLR
jgi:hypothetical protein